MLFRSVWYKNKFGELDPAVQNRAKYHVGEITKNRNNAAKIKDYFKSLAADQAAREVEVWTTLQQQQTPTTTQQSSTPPVGGAPKAGAPTAQELANFDKLISNAAKAQS